MRSIKGLIVMAMLFGIIFVGLSSDAIAEKFPSKPMEIIISSSPGSGGSIFTQLMAKLGGKYLGVPIDVLHKPGGNGNVACDYLYRKPADGYTLNLWNASYAGYMNFPGYSTKPTDFIYLLKLQKTLYSLFVHNDSPFQTIQDILEYAKKNPKKLDIGSSKLGNPQHLNIMKFAKAAGIEVNYIPYKGTGEVVKEVMGKHLTAGEAQPYLIIPQEKAGYLKQLLLFNEERIKELPDLPVPSDLGLKYPFYHQAYGIMLKKGVPPDRLAIIKGAYLKVMKDPEFIEFTKRSAGQEIIFVDTEEFTKMFLKDFEMVGQLLHDLKIIKK